MTREEAFCQSLVRAQRPRLVGTYVLPSGRACVVYYHQDFYGPGADWIDARWNVDPWELDFYDLSAWRSRCLPRVHQAITALTGKPVTSVRTAPFPKTPARLP